VGAKRPAIDLSLYGLDTYYFFQIEMRSEVHFSGFSPACQAHLRAGFEGFSTTNKSLRAPTDESVIAYDHRKTRLAAQA